MTTPGGRRHWATWGVGGACAGLALAAAILWFTRKSRRLVRAAYQGLKPRERCVGLGLRLAVSER